MSDSPSTFTPRTAAADRPLSPHLSIYRMPLTAGVMSITHRASGVFLTLGVIALVALLWTAAYCPESYARVPEYAMSWWGRSLLVLWTLAFFYHFLNGIRHLGWDTGRGLELEVASRTGYIVIIGSVLMTALIWYRLLA